MQFQEIFFPSGMSRRLNAGSIAGRLGNIPLHVAKHLLHVVNLLLHVVNHLLHVAELLLHVVERLLHVVELLLHVVNRLLHVVGHRLHVVKPLLHVVVLLRSKEKASADHEQVLLQKEEHLFVISGSEPDIKEPYALLSGEISLSNKCHLYKKVQNKSVKHAFFLTPLKQQLNSRAELPEI